MGRRYAFLNQHAARSWTAQPATCRSDVSATRRHRASGIRCRDADRRLRGFSAARHPEPAAAGLVRCLAAAFRGRPEPGRRSQRDWLCAGCLYRRRGAVLAGLSRRRRCQVVDRRHVMGRRTGDSFIAGVDRRVGRRADAVPADAVRRSTRRSGPRLSRSIGHFRQP